ncbi:MAG: dicarboxylate/amino acid:cation symporter [Candidatus Paracaedibacteraceae bacterium]|nr:dicarboxylate/amino acid:cation symporter [Candidatus Paracaedibacteraceae bacterium]
MLKSLPVQLVLCVILAFFTAEMVDTTAASFFYSLSCALKDFLMMVLPFVIISYMASAILSLEQKAPLLIISILVMVCLSNLAAVFTSYGISLMALPFVTSGKMVDLAATKDLIAPLFSVPFPQVLEPKWAMIIGLIYGLTFSMYPHKKATDVVLKMRDLVTKILQKTFIPLLPVYVFGFVLKMQMEGNLSVLFQTCGQVILLMIGVIIGYILLLYAMAANFSPQKLVHYLRNIFPAALTGFTTMSSAATMPLTLAATEENIKDKNFAQLIIPATVNIHLLGDALGIPILGLATLQLSGMPLPDLTSFAVFAGFFCLAKFSTAGIPGGGILVLLPTLQTHLGLSVEMIGFVTTLYILQDCIFTSSNVVGNGGFALVVHRLMKLIRLVKPQATDACPELTV